MKEPIDAMSGPATGTFGAGPQGRMLSRRFWGRAGLFGAAGLILRPWWPSPPSWLRRGLVSAASAAEGKRASRFRLRAARGAKWQGVFDLGEHLGQRPVLVSFFATWCRPCEIELPYLQKLHQRYGSRGLMIVAVGMDGPESAVRVGPFTRRLGVTFPAVHDADSRVTSRYNPRNFAPFLVAIDKEGRIALEKDGWTPEHEKALTAKVQELLKSEGASPSGQEVPEKAPAPAAPDKGSAKDRDKGQDTKGQGQAKAGTTNKRQKF